jgi:TatD DNase family protein
MNIYDSHCHLAEVAKLYDINENLEAARKRGISGWLSCAQSKEEVRWHQLNKFDDVKYAAGIHPVYAQGTPLSINELEDIIKTGQLTAIGEIGLDKRNIQLDKQVKIFQEQLELARQYSLPVVYHVVGHLDIFFKILSENPVPGIWHGFSNPKEVVKQFSKFDLTYSIGHVPIAALKNDTINEIIKTGNYLLETDAPYNLKKPDKTADFNFNPLIELVNYAKIVARLNGVKTEALYKDMLHTSKRYFK